MVNNLFFRWVSSLFYSPLNSRDKNMKAKIVETDGKKTAVELFGLDPEETYSLVERQLVEPKFSRVRGVEIEKGEYLACTEQIDDVPYLYQVSIFYADKNFHREFYYLYKLESLR